jgi:hypothetical protein
MYEEPLSTINYRYSRLTNAKASPLLVRPGLSKESRPLTASVNLRRKKL